ncbi:hypothetical protein BJF79_24185 [Actinomadura sp. CNU-125]|nr:hypothetical protein BJF79_24185 [Actinomadura sp. CNU-125]
MLERSTPSTARSPLTFLVLLFALSIPFWVGGALVEASDLLPMGMPVSAFQFVLPLVVAAVLAFREEGRRGVVALLKRTVSPRGFGAKAWWLPVWLLIPAIGLLVFALMPLAGVPPNGTHSPLTAVPLLFAVYFVSAFAEEAGWTAYLLQPLRDRFGPLQAGLLIGIAWAVWHLVGWAQGDRSALWIAGQFVSTVALRVLMVWIFEGSGGVVLTALVVHALVNVTQSVIPGFTEHAAPALLNGAIQVLVAALIALRWRPAPPG